MSLYVMSEDQLRTLVKDAFCVYGTGTIHDENIEKLIAWDECRKIEVVEIRIGNALIQPVRVWAEIAAGKAL